jgi:hypothetical protein
MIWGGVKSKRLKVCNVYAMILEKRMKEMMQTRYLILNIYFIMEPMIHIVYPTSIVKESEYSRMLQVF